MNARIATRFVTAVATSALENRKTALTTAVLSARGIVSTAPTRSARASRGMTTTMALMSALNKCNSKWKGIGNRDELSANGND